LKQEERVMDLYLSLRYLHFIGFMLIGGGLLAVWVSEWRGYSATRTVLFAEAAYYTAILYDYVVVPGALLMIATGPLLIWKLGYNYFDTPWLTGMWGLFVFEFIEGNTITRVQFRRTLRVSRSLPEDEPLTEEIKADARTWVGRFVHFLDIPIVLAIVFFGVTKPDSWLTVGEAIGVAIAAAVALMYAVPRLAEGMSASSKSPLRQPLRDHRG
jgi:uncharacterized membrane protein